MRPTKMATLGELIAAVADEISPRSSASADIDMLVAYIVRDLFAKRRVQLRRRAVLKIA